MIHQISILSSRPQNPEFWNNPVISPMKMPTLSNCNNLRCQRFTIQLHAIEDAYVNIYSFQHLVQNSLFQMSHFHAFNNCKWCGASNFIVAKCLFAK